MPEEKHCEVCGRRIEWRRKWARDWEAVRYCSRACRRNKLGPLDRRLETTIMELVRERGRGSICPSEAARAVSADRWRSLLEPARSAARRLTVAGKVEMTQKGRVVDPSTARGPVRIRRKR